MFGSFRKAVRLGLKAEVDYDVRFTCFFWFSFEFLSDLGCGFVQWWLSGLGVETDCVQVCNLVLIDRRISSIRTRRLLVHLLDIVVTS